MWGKTLNQFLKKKHPASSSYTTSATNFQQPFGILRSQRRGSLGSTAPGIELAPCAVAQRLAVALRLELGDEAPWRLRGCRG